MSWDADLIDDRGHNDGSWNYTHNCNGMIHTAAKEAGIEFPHDPTPCYALPKTTGGGLTYYPDGLGDVSWWELLDGMDGPEGAAFLDKVIRVIENDPDRFDAMNPSNGWGDRKFLVEVLIEMRDSVPEWPTKWTASG